VYVGLAGLHRDAWMALPKDRVKETLVAGTNQTLLFVKASTDFGCVKKVITFWKGRQWAIRQASGDAGECISNAHDRPQERSSKDDCANKTLHRPCISLDGVYNEFASRVYLISRRFPKTGLVQELAVPI
jgi:hypothetical protein